jgi:hypothetical protein
MRDVPQRNLIITMARKRNPENDLVGSSGTAPAPVRRKTPAARPKYSPTTADTQVSPVPEPETEEAIASSLTEYEPPREEIARLAFLYWEARGYQGGSPEEDWFRAEQELRKQVLAAAV